MSQQEDLKVNFRNFWDDLINIFFVNLAKLRRLLEGCQQMTSHQEGARGEEVNDIETIVHKPWSQKKQLGDQKMYECMRSLMNVS